MINEKETTSSSYYLKYEEFFKIIVHEGMLIMQL